jgi:2-polyprenyl-3-methyl-5-hydroxy-6-metoxy-1,4-benzoquinol methylase
MKHQDFELYAKEKPFGPKMPATWVTAFHEVSNNNNLGTDELKVLDVGCGDGRIYPFLLGEGFVAKNIHGVEVSQSRVDRCHALGWENALYISNGAKLPYLDGTFHIINFMEVIEHIPFENIDAVLNELYRVLAEDGVLLITTPNYPIKRFYDVYAAISLGKKERWHDDPTHVSLYNHYKLRNKLKTFFNKITPRTFKDGFLYKYIPYKFFKHKIFFLCSFKNK